MAYGRMGNKQGTKPSKLGGRSANQKSILRKKKKTKKKVHNTQSTRRGY